MPNLNLHSTRCAICGTEDNAKELYQANLASDDFQPSVFSARRMPDRIHYRLVECRTCGLVRSDPVADEQTLTNLYERSTFDYGNEVASLRATYGKLLSRLDRFNASRGSLMEVGCGNGFFLHEAKKRGYASVRGVEPGAQVVAGADPSIRDSIVCDVMRPGLFAPEQFDVVCLFQVFDHLVRPGDVLDECYRILRPGGLILCLNHNIRAVSARLLGERSPVIDIEHTFLYTPATMRRIFTQHGYDVLELKSVFNLYSVDYLFRLLPLPQSSKDRMLTWLRASRLGRLRVSVPLGNMYLIAAKPERQPFTLNPR